MSALALAAEGFDIVGLTIDYPGRPLREKEVASKIANKLPFSSTLNVSIDCPDVLTLPALRGTAFEGWIPYRNLLFWAIAANQAARIGASFIAAGHEHNDQIAFSDVSKTFFQSIAELLGMSGNSGYDGSLAVRLPLLALTDQQQVQFFTDKSNAQLLFSTWSCWRDVFSPCNVCAACRARKRFLKLVKTSISTRKSEFRSSHSIAQENEP